MDVKSLISFNQGVMTYKTLHGLCPDSLCHKFLEISMISEYEKRNLRDLQTPKVGLAQTKRSFYFVGVKDYNEIPDNTQKHSAFHAVMPSVLWHVVSFPTGVAA